MITYCLEGLFIAMATSKQEYIMLEPDFQSIYSTFGILIIQQIPLLRISIYYSCIVY